MSEESIKNNSQISSDKGGVKTPEGKAISRYNAQRHSILRETISEYENVDAESIYNDLAEDIRPEGRMQEIMMEVITTNTIRLQRIAKAEGEILKWSISGGDHLMYSADSRTYYPNLPYETVEKLDLYSRYQTATENRIYRALLMLKQLKTYETRQ